MLDRSDFEILDHRYVQKDDCNNRHTAETKEISDIAMAQAKNNTLLGILVKIQAAQLGAIASAIIAAIMNLILK